MTQQKTAVVLLDPRLQDTSLSDSAVIALSPSFGMIFRDDGSAAMPDACGSCYYWITDPSPIRRLDK